MSESLPGTIGQRLAELREQRGLTREELVELVGVSTSTLNRLESGQIQKFSDEKLAHRGEKMPESYTLPEQLLFLSLRALYGNIGGRKSPKPRLWRKKPAWSSSMRSLRNGWQSTGRPWKSATP